MKLKTGDQYGPFLLGKLRDTNDTLNVFNATVIEPGNIGEPKGIVRENVGRGNVDQGNVDQGNVDQGNVDRADSYRENIARENSNWERGEEVELFILSETTGVNRCEVSSDEFLKKMQKAVELCHPSVLRVLSTGRVEDTVYAATEAVHGFTFGELPLSLNGRGLPPPMAVWMLAEAGDALAVLGDHSRKHNIQTTGALYLAPSDIYAENTGKIKLGRLDLTASLLATWRGSKNLLKDKFGYMSPEQIMGQPATQLSDLFICGILLHELLTGRRLFAKDSKSKTILAIKDPHVPAPSEIAPWIERKLDELVLCALEKDPQKRPRSITAWTESLKNYLTEHHPTFDSSKAQELLRQGIEEVSNLSPSFFNTTAAKTSGPESEEEWCRGEASTVATEDGEKRGRNTIQVEAAEDMVAAPTRTAMPAVRDRTGVQDSSVMTPTTNIDHGLGFFSWLRQEKWGIHDTLLALFAAVLLCSAFALLWLR